ncbi:Ral GTPase-activating protein subunit alpha-2 [Irineochytrium annulatum]|nr:Ral GTPase-activating protein subunit alpha-2 [Irineochytrium annulatum]
MADGAGSESGKRLERALKKARGFLDDKQRPKHRMASLFSFMDSATEQDQARFYQDHDAQIFGVMLDTFNHQVEKIRGKEKNERSAQQGLGKETIDLFKILVVLKKIFQFLPDRIPYIENIGTILQSLLIPTNHAKLRLEGFRILLLWLNNLNSDLVEAKALYANAIPLSIFEPFPLPSPPDIAKSDCSGDDGLFGDGGRTTPPEPDYLKPAVTASNPAVSQLFTANSAAMTPIVPGAPASPADAIDLLSEALDNMVQACAGSCSPALFPSQRNLAAVHEAVDGSGATEDAGRRKRCGEVEGRSEGCVLNRSALMSALFMWECFKGAYLRQLFPAIARKCGMWTVGDDESDGFPTCPVPILQQLLNFITHHVLDPSLIGTGFSPTATSPVQTPSGAATLAKASVVLRAILLSDEVNREFLHEIVRQSFLVPFAHIDVGRLGLFILRISFTDRTKNDERPVFLQRVNKGSRTATIEQTGASIENVATSAMGSAELHPARDKECTTSGSSIAAHDWQKEDQDNSNANMFIRRYIRYVSLLFLDKKDYIQQVDSQVTLMKEGVQFYRLLALESHVSLSPDTWLTLMRTLNEINLHILCRPNKFAGVASPPQAEDICNLLIESSLCIWVRSAFRTEESWKIVTKLTKIVATHVYGIDIDTVPKDEIDTKTALRLRAASLQSSSRATRPSATVQYPRSLHSERSQMTISDTYTIAESPHAHELPTALLPTAIEEAAAEAAPVAQPAPAPAHSAGGSAPVGHHANGPSALNIVTLSRTGLQGSNPALDDHGLATQGHGIGAKAAAASDLDSPSLSPMFSRREGTTVPLNTLTSNSKTGASLHSVISFPSLDAINEKPPLATGFKIPLLNPLCLTRLGDFANIQNMPWWDHDAALFMWKNMICVLGDLNVVQGPANHAEAMACLVQVLDTLAKIRSIQPYDGLINSSKDLAVTETVRQNCITILTSMVAVINLFSNAISHSSTDDLATLPALPPKKTSADALNKESSPSNEGTQTSSETAPFVAATPTQGGLEVLLRRNRLLSDTSSLVGSTFPGLDIANFVSGDGHLPFMELKIQLKELLIMLVEKERDLVRQDRNPETHAMLIWATTALAFDEMISSDRQVARIKVPMKTIVDDTINVLLDHLTLSNIKVINATVDGLCLFAQSKAVLHYLDNTVLTGIIAKFVGALTEHLLFQNGMTTKEIRGQIVSRQLYCLLEWVMVVPPNLFKGKLSLMVFEVIENALDVAAGEGEVSSSAVGAAAQAGSGSGPNSFTGNGAPTPSHAPYRLRGFRGFTDNAGPNTPPLNLKGLRSTSGFTAFMKTDSQAFPESNTDEEESEDLVIKEAAENVLNHILHHFNNFASPFGPAVISSQILESAFAEDGRAEDKSLYFSFNDTTLISIIEIPGVTPLDTRSRIVVRDMTGKFVWDNYLFYESLKTMRSRIQRWEQFPPDFVHQTDKQPSASFAVEPANYLGMVPSLQPNVDVDECPSCPPPIEGNHPDCLLQPKVSLNTPSDPLPTSVPAVDAVSAAVQIHLEQEEPYHAAFLPSLKAIASHQSALREANQIRNSIGEVPRRSDAEAAVDCWRSYKPEAAPRSSERINAFGRSRQFLSHFGHVQFDGLKEDYFHLLTKTPALYRDVKGLDRKHGREVMKVAVMYVGPGQEDEAVLFKNECGSSMYDEFVSSLGWEVDITSHEGYLGGLERSQATGNKAVYYCNSTIEILYHDVTKMPTDPADPKQLKKKRHIGNDHVHIVWNEHYREYRKNTIGGDFGNAVIAITPMSNGLFSVEITKDQKVPSFGPLLNRSVVSKRALGPLVRATSINAYRSALHIGQHHASAPHHAFSQRAADIRLVTSRHKATKWTYEKFTETLFTPDEGTNSNPPANPSIHVLGSVSAS